MDVARGRAEDETWGNPYHLVFHEYVHVVLHLNFGALPGWLNEGLAEYWGSTIISGERIYEGRYIGYHIQTLRRSTLLPIERVLSAGSEEFSDANRATMLYAQSWALVHYLLLGADQRKGQIDRYVELLRAGRSTEGARREAFGDPAALGRELDSYVRRYVFRSIRTQAALDATTGPVSTRAVPEAESLALRAAFHVASGHPAAAAALAAEALRLDPSSAAAHEALALAAWRAGRTGEALAELEKAVATPGASDFAHYLHGRLLWSDSGRESAPLERVVASLRHAIELNPASAEAHEALALALAARGGAADEPLRLAVRASELDPATVEYRLTALRLAAHAGAVQQARQQAQQVLTWAQGEDRRRVEDLIAELSDMRRLPADAACEAGHAPACLELGQRYRTGAGGPKDLLRAAALFEKACEGGEPEGCASFGWLLEEGAGAPKDMARAVGLYRRACDAGLQWSCARLGMALAWGEGVTPDPAAAGAVLEKACTAGETSACAPLGSLLRRGGGGAKDLARAEALLRSACDAGSAWGCGELASLLLERGTPEARQEAAALYLRACEDDSPGACAFLAQLHELGRGVPRDATRAKALYGKACSGGYAPACAKAAEAAK